MVRNSANPPDAIFFLTWWWEMAYFLLKVLQLQSLLRRFEGERLCSNMMAFLSKLSLLRFQRVILFTWFRECHVSQVAWKLYHLVHEPLTVTPSLVLKLLYKCTKLFLYFLASQQFFQLEMEKDLESFSYSLIFWECKRNSLTPLQREARKR